MCQFCDLTFFGLAEPQAPMLESYVAALRRGWSASTVRDVSAEQLAAVEADAAAFLASLTDAANADPKGQTVELPDGGRRAKLPMRVRWMWDGEFCGAINLRWLPGTDALPPDVSGHIGYGVVPWKRGHGFATRALRHMLAEARDVGLPRVEITTDIDNIASQRVIERNGGLRAGTREAVAGMPAKAVWEIVLDER